MFTDTFPCSLQMTKRLDCRHPTKFPTFRSFLSVKDHTHTHTHTTHTHTHWDRERDRERTERERARQKWRDKSFPRKTRTQDYRFPVSMQYSCQLVTWQPDGRRAGIRGNYRADVETSGTGRRSQLTAHSKNSTS